MIKPVVYINKGLDVLSVILKEVNPKKIFIVSGKKSFSSVSDGIEIFLRNKKKYIFNDFCENPNISDIYKGISLYNDYMPDLILAVGGGTAIDIAKSINILAVQKKNIESIIKGDEDICCESSTPLVVMPTTAGTGSEATNFSVVYIGKRKYSLQHKSMLPNYVILDPYLVRTMPEYVAACTAFDALSQAIESYWSKNATEESKRFSSEAIRLILPNLTASIIKPTVEIRKDIVKAAYLSGCGINITKTTAPHAISYSLTSYFGIPHGHAVASLLGQTTVVSYLRSTEKQKKIFEDIFSMFDCDTHFEFCEKWWELMLLCGLEPKLGEMGVRDKDVATIINGVNVERMTGHPVLLDKYSIKEIIEKSL